MATKVGMVDTAWESSIYSKNGCEKLEYSGGNIPHWFGGSIKGDVEHVTVKYSLDDLLVYFGVPG